MNRTFSPDKLTIFEAAKGAISQFFKVTFADVVGTSKTQSGKNNIRIGDLCKRANQSIEV
jgi:hypothetical protein